MCGRARNAHGELLPEMWFMQHNHSNGGRQRRKHPFRGRNTKESILDANKRFIYYPCLNFTMDLENTADEIAALASIFAGIIVILTSVFAMLFSNATIEVGTVETLGGLLIAAPSLYLFGKGVPK